MPRISNLLDPYPGACGLNRIEEKVDAVNVG